MSDPSRLRDIDGASSFERALLASASLDREPEDGAARALVALGIGTAVGAAALTAASTPPTIAASSGGIGTGLTVKLLAVVAIVGGTIAGAVAVSRHDAVVPSAPVLSAPVKTLAVTPSAGIRAPLPPSSDVASPSETIDVAALPSAPLIPAHVQAAPSGSSRRAPAPSASAPPTGPSLSEELAVVDRARAAIAAGDLAKAEAALDEHDARFPSGALVAEATVARIELLLARGDPAGAHALGERFLREQPGSTHERRVRALLRRTQTSTSIP